MTVSINLRWTLLVAANVVFWCVLSLQQSEGANSGMTAPGGPTPTQQRAEIIVQLKEIKTAINILVAYRRNRRLARDRSFAALTHAMPATRTRPPTAYTLLEVLIVVAIIGVLAGMMIPDTSAGVQTRLQSVAAILGRDIGYARNLAVTNADNYKITFDLTANKWTLTHSGTNTALDALPISPLHRASATATQQTVTVGQPCQHRRHGQPVCRLGVKHAAADRQRRRISIVGRNHAHPGHARLALGRNGYRHALHFGARQSDHRAVLGRELSVDRAEHGDIFRIVKARDAQRETIMPW